MSRCSLSPNRIWLLVSIGALLVLGLTYIQSTNALVRGVNRSPLLAAATSEFQTEFDAINTGQPTTPFAKSDQAAAWAAHSRDVVAAFADVSGLIRSGVDSPLKVKLEHAGWLFNWATPTLKFDVVPYSDGEPRNAYRFQVRVEFVQQESQWVVKSVHYNESFEGSGPTLLADSCIKWVSTGGIDKTGCY
jgi:hypothetical protein